MCARKQLLYFRIKPPPPSILHSPTKSQSILKALSKSPQTYFHSNAFKDSLMCNFECSAPWFKQSSSKSHKAKDFHQETNITEFVPCTSCLLHISYFHLFSKYVLFIFLYLVLHVSYFLLGFHLLSIICPVKVWPWMIFSIYCRTSPLRDFSFWYMWVSTSSAKGLQPQLIFYFNGLVYFVS